MPHIQIIHDTAVPIENNSQIIEEVTAAYARTSGKPIERVWVTLHRVEPESWGVGGVPLTELL